MQPSKLRGTCCILETAAGAVGWFTAREFYSPSRAITGFLKLHRQPTATTAPTANPHGMGVSVAVGHGATPSKLGLTHSKNSGKK
jgi:hypothetical protein